MDWHKIKNAYPDTWYDLVDFLADPGIYRERRIRIEGNTVAADTKEADSDGWYEIDTLHQRDLYEFFEQYGIFVVILYDEWIGYFNYELYSQAGNVISPKFQSRKEAETAAFMKAFVALEEQVCV